MLIAAGADVDAVSGSHWTPLRLAAVHDTTSNGCTSLLLAAGADVNAVAPLGGTALHMACHTNNTAAVKLLLTAGADLNASIGRYTPVMVAAKQFVTLRGSPDALDTLNTLLHHFGSSPAEIWTLVEAAAAAARMHSASPDMARLAVHKLLLTAAQLDAPATQAALQQHFPYHKDAAALVAGALMDMVLEAAAAAADAGAQNTATQQLLVDAALMQTLQQQNQHAEQKQEVQVTEEEQPPSGNT